jgi:hypothetical protein
LQENVNRCSVWQSGQRIRAALRSPHEAATLREGEPAARVATVKILLDNILDNRPEEAVLPLETSLVF